MNSKDILLLSILTFLTIAVWTVFDIYHTSVSTTITPVQENYIKKLDPTLDTQIIDTLKNRTEMK